MSFAHLTPVELDDDTIKKNIVGNTIKMLMKRGVVVSNMNDLTNEIFFKLRTNEMCEFTAGEYNNKYSITYLPEQKMSAITRQSPIGRYIHDFPENHHIIIVEDVTPRVITIIKKDFPNVEIFLKKEMSFNLMDSIYVPEHILLSDAEKKEVLISYGCTEREMPKIFVSDPVSRYFNAKVGQMFRIIRPSEMTGKAVYYRIVIGGITSK